MRERERERGGGGGNHFYFEDDGFRPWPNLPTGSVKERERERERERVNSFLQSRMEI